MFYILMHFYWFNPLLPHDWNFAGQFLILNLSGNCCHLLNSHSGIFYGCSFKLWYRIFLVRFFIPKPNDKFLWRYWSYDALHGVGGAYAKSIFVDELGAQESSLLNCTPKVLFSCWLMPRIALNILNASRDLPWFVDDLLDTGRLRRRTPRPQFDICKRVGCSYGIGQIRTPRRAPRVWCCFWWWCRSQHGSW